MKIKIYHFEEESDDRSNGRKNDLSSKQEKNDDGVDAITIGKYYEKKSNEKNKTYQYIF